MQTTLNRPLDIIFNRNAGKRATKKQQILDMIEREFSRHINLIETASEEDAEFQIAALVHKGVEFIGVLGGDGTVQHAYNVIIKEYKRVGLKQTRELPHLVILPFGSGNAIAYTFNQGTIEEILTSTITGNYVLKVFDLIKFHDEYTHFCSGGFDADAAEARERTPGNGITGYLSAIFGDVYPRFGYYSGLEAEVKSAGEVIYNGPCKAVMCGTIPYYGYGLKIFPRALEREDTMQVRIVNMGVPEMLLRSPLLWLGVRPTVIGDPEKFPRMSDFLVNDLYVKFNKPVPEQAGGDPRGWSDTLDLQVAKSKLKIVSVK